MRKVRPKAEGCNTVYCDLGYGNLTLGIFKWGDIKINRLLPENQHIQRRL